jgi:hypothetical protein
MGSPGTFFTPHCLLQFLNATAEHSEDAEKYNSDKATLLPFQSRPHPVNPVYPV